MEKLTSSEHSQLTSAATSSALPTLPIGMSEVMCASTSGEVVAFMGVFAAGGGLVGLDSQSHAGQGFHAVQGRYSMEAMRAALEAAARRAVDAQTRTA